MRPPRKEPLSREKILDAALAIVDAEGLAALSMRRVGAAVGVEAMSLYNHVPSKAALLDGIHERILAEAARVPRPRIVRGWTAHVRHEAEALRRALTTHPNALTLFAARPAVTPASLVALEQHLGYLQTAGFAPLEALHVVQCVVAFVVGHTLASVKPDADDAPSPDYARLDAERFPHVRRTAAALGRYDAEREFARGLDALLTGFATQLAT